MSQTEAYRNRSSSSRRSRCGLVSGPVAALESLESRQLLTAVSVSLDSGATPGVIEYDADTLAQNKNFLAFSNSFQGGVRVAMGDINGDGTADIVAGAGAGGPALVKVFDGVTGAEIKSFAPYSPNIYQGGVFVAAGDVNGDGLDDIIVGSGAGVRSNVRIFDSQTGSLLRSFNPFGKDFSGGVTVAAGDVNGDGRADIIAGTAEGAAVVSIFDGPTGRQLNVFLPFSSAFTGGVNVAAGDVNGDGRDDVIVGTAGGTRTTVRTFDVHSGATLNSFEPYGAVLTGVRVAAGDVNGDGKAEIITGAGPGASPHVKIFDSTSLAELKSFLAFGGGTTGVYVGADIPTIKNTAPTLSIPQTALETAPDTPTTVAPTGTVSDADAYNYNGGVLQVTIGRSQVQKNDSLTLGNGVQIQGSDVLVSGIAVGTLSGGGGKKDPLVILFNEKGTAATVQAVVRGVIFQAGSDPKKSVAGTRRIFFQVWDGGGLTSGYQIRTVNVS